MKRKGSLFRMLVKSYVVFAFFLVVSLIAALAAPLFLFVNNNPAGFDPYAVIDGQNTAEAEFLFNLGAWAEGLDASYNVITVSGEKQDAAYSYTLNEIYALLNAIPDIRGSVGRQESVLLGSIEGSGGDSRLYYGFIREAEPTAAEPDLRWWLIKLPADDISMTFNLELNVGGAFGAYFYIFAGLFAVLFAANCVMISLYLSRRIKKPLAAINEGLDKIRAGRQNAQVAEFKAAAELNNIRESFNYMSEKLNEERQTRESAEQRKNRLLADLSHDIKTPVATIKAYAGALAAGIVPDEKTDSYYRIIEAKADRVSGLIGDLSEALTVTDGTYQIKPETFDIAELFRELCAAVIDEAEQNGLTFTADIPDSALPVSADKGLISRALENLLDNAVKYNRTGRLISASIRARRGEILLEVADDGIAIPDEYKDTIFDAFVRADKARTTVGGTGLGLAIVKGIAERHGGRAVYERRGGLNVFTVILPVC